MNIDAHRGRAKDLESDVQSLMDDFNKALEARGFGEFKVISFAVGPKMEAPKLLTLAGSPCPTKCRVLPDGQIECKPDCS